jgi:hypothetical protein
MLSSPASGLTSRLSACCPTRMRPAISLEISDADLLALIRQEFGFEGFIAERVGCDLGDLKAHIAARPVLAEALARAQAIAGEDDASDRAAEACRRGAAAGNPDLVKLAKLRLAERQREAAASWPPRLIGH